MYLFRRSDGAQYDRVKELRVSASLPDKRIGPLHLRAEKAGPGHYVVRRAAHRPCGRLEARARRAREQVRRVPRARLEVPIK